MALRPPPLAAAAFVCALGLASACGRRAAHDRRAPRTSPSDERIARAPPVAPPPAAATTPTPAAFADGGPPSGYENVAVWDLIPTSDGAAVLLIDASRTTILPILVGSTEALTIRLDLDGERHTRPLTHDLLASIVKELGGQPVKAQIDDLRDDTYFGSVFVRQGARVLQLDARPSDAIAMALGSNTPIYVSRSVMLASGVPRESIEAPGDGRARQIPREKPSPISL